MLLLRILLSLLLTFLVLSGTLRRLRWRNFLFFLLQCYRRLNFAHLQGKFRFELLYKLGGKLLNLRGIRVILSEPDTSLNWFVVFWAALAKNFEAKDLRLVIMDLWRNHNCSWKMLDEDLWEGNPKNASIKIESTRLAIVAWQAVRDIRLLAARTINFHSTYFRFVVHAHR